MKVLNAVQSVVVVTLALAACAGPTYLGRSSLVPAADGKVETSLGDNGNVKLKVEVEHLAPPNRIAPGASVYVVWAKARTGGARQQNLGALLLDDKLKGMLETVTPLRSFTLSITPEADQASATPTGPVVLQRELSVQ